MTISKKKEQELAALQAHRAEILRQKEEETVGGISRGNIRRIVRLYQKFQSFANVPGSCDDYIFNQLKESQVLSQTWDE